MEEHDQPPLRVGEIVDGVDLGEQLASQPDGGDLTVDVAGRETGTSRSQPLSLRLRQVINSRRRIP